MNGLILMIPLLFIRFFILKILNKEALKSLNFFAPLPKSEMFNFYIYHLTTAMLLLYPFFTTVNKHTVFFPIGIAFYLFGILITLIATINFALPKNIYLKKHGLYRFSRNPMYLGYFFFFLGCALLLNSFFYLLIIILFQLSSHWIILAEEQWCEKKYGQSFLDYKSTVRRYF